MIQKRYDYIDFVNIFACFSVICLHCSGSVFNYGIADDREWFLSMFIQTLAHSAVPLFFMITGTTLLNYRDKYDTKVFLKKRFMRTVIPFLFWSCFYIFYQAILNGTNFFNLQLWRNGIFNNEAQNIFWFFYVIFGIYLCIPVFSLIAKEENFKIMEYCCALFFVAQAIYPIVTRFIMPINSGLLPTLGLGYTGYLFFGWVICHEKYSKKIRISIYILGICGALLMFFGTYWLSKIAGGTDTMLMEYTSIACMPMSVSVMLFAKHVNWEKAYRIIPRNIISKISSASLGIYTIHMVFLILCSRYEEIYTHPMYIMTFGPIIIYSISLILVLIMKKIPVIKKCVM